MALTYNGLPAIDAASDGTMRTTLASTYTIPSHLDGAR